MLMGLRSPLLLVLIILVTRGGNLYALDGTKEAQCLVFLSVPRKKKQVKPILFGQWQYGVNNCAGNSKALSWNSKSEVGGFDAHPAHHKYVMANLGFYIGAQVQCVDDNWQATDYTKQFIHPVLGNIYTIRDILDFGKDGICFLLEEIVNPNCNLGIYPSEICWYSWHFRPLKKTDISSLVPKKKSKPKVVENV